jgi:hypothetical protein
MANARWCFWTIILDATLGPAFCNCYHHNLAGLEGGPRARWAQRINVINMRIDASVGVCRVELAMYLV